jgi:hypothetical protein
MKHQRPISSSKIAILFCAWGAISAEGGIVLDSFSDTQARTTMTYHQVYSGDGYSPTIVGGHRDDYIRNFAPATPTSVIYEVTGGKLEYTTFTRYDDNNFLTLQYGNLPAADQLNLNLENEKAAGSFRFALAAAAPTFRLRINFYTETDEFQAFVLLDNAVVDIPIRNFLSTIDNRSAAHSDLRDINYFNLAISNTAITEGQRSLFLDTFEVVPEPTSASILMCGLVLLTSARPKRNYRR